MLQNVPKVTPYHFFMPHIRVADLMNDQDKAFISRVSQLHLEAKDGKLNFFDFHAKLKAMQNCVIFAKRKLLRRQTPLSSIAESPLRAVRSRRWQIGWASRMVRPPTSSPAFTGIRARRLAMSFGALS